MSDAAPERRILYRGRKIDLALQAVDCRDGTRVEREVVLHRGAVALLASIDEGRLCLLKNRRYAVGRTLIEVPAGTINPGETPDQAAVRELREETGYTAGRIERIAEWYVSPGVFTETMFLYWCADLTAGASAPEAGEELETIPVAWDDALTMVRDGRILDAKTMLAILIGDQFRSGRTSAP